MINFVIYSHLPKDFTYNILANKIKNIIGDKINVIDETDLKHEVLNKETDKLLLYEPQNHNHLKRLLNLSQYFLKKNTYIYFYESVFETKAKRHIWKNNEELFKKYGTVFSSYKKDLDLIKNIWLPCHHDLYGFSMIDIDYFSYYKKGNDIKKYTKKRFDIDNSESYENNIISKNSFENREFAAVQPITGTVDDYRIKKIEEISKFIDIDIYGMNPLLKKIKNYKGSINITKEDGGRQINSNRKARATSQIKILSNYKFIFVFENECIDGYFSERFIHALYSNSIVIYFGCKNSHLIFPDIFSNGIINGWNFESMQDLSIFIKNMNNDNISIRIDKIKKYRDKYAEMLCQNNIFKKMLVTIFN